MSKIKDLLTKVRIVTKDAASTLRSIRSGLQKCKLCGSAIDVVDLGTQGAADASGSIYSALVTRFTCNCGEYSNAVDVRLMQCLFNEQSIRDTYDVDYLAGRGAVDRCEV